MRTGVMGINHKLAHLQLRETLAKACQKCFMAGSSTHGEHTFVLLSTCNRTEIYFSSEDLAETHTYLLQILRKEIDEEFDQKIYSYFGHDCFLHLSRVTAGLDSAILAETEIQGQVKATYEKSVKMVNLPSDLHYLFQKSLKIAKKIRCDLFAGHNIPDIKHAVFNTGTHLFEDSKKMRILFIGASEINCKILHFLQSKKLGDITLCNRSNESLHSFANEYKVQALEWERRAEWVNYDWIIFGTKSPEYLLTPDHLTKETLSQKLIMDLCVPRNVDPKVGCHPQITLLNIDQINRMVRARAHKTTKLLMQAETSISHSVKIHAELHQSKKKVQRLPIEYLVDKVN